MPSNDVLNFFDPNLDIPAHHENQLTRAFLVVLRMSPAAHREWLSLVAPHLKLYNLPRPWSFDTQRWQMFEQAPDVSEPIEGISVLQAPDVEAVKGSVQVTERSQVLDGLVRYGDALLIVIETKLAGRASSYQAQYLNVHGAQVQFDGSVRTVDWREFLAVLAGLVEAEVVAGAERSLIEDFLFYIERHFPHLGPFRTLALCKENWPRVNMRLKAALDEIGVCLANHWLDLPDRSTVSRARLEFDESLKCIQLVLYPADTLTQAKAFYTRPGTASNVLSLREVGWHLRPNFHFGHMAGGFAWTRSDATVGEYIAYWQKGINRAGALQRNEWEDFWKDLFRLKFARNEDKAGFDKKFTDTKRQSATPRPGLKCAFSWSLAEATALDDRDQFVKAVVDQLNIALKALGENPYESVRSARRASSVIRP